MLRRAAVLKRICDRWMAQNARSDGTVSFIMNSYALRRKFITKEVIIYDQVS